MALSRRTCRQMLQRLPKPQDFLLEILSRHMRTGQNTHMQKYHGCAALLSNCFYEGLQRIMRVDRKTNQQHLARKAPTPKVHLPLNSHIQQSRPSNRAHSGDRTPVSLLEMRLRIDPAEEAHSSTGSSHSPARLVCNLTKGRQVASALVEALSTSEGSHTSQRGMNQ